MIAFLLHFVLCLADLDHCSRIAWTAGGPRCVEVELRPRCEATEGWHSVLGTPVCTEHCGGGRPTS